LRGQSFEELQPGQLRQAAHCGATTRSGRPCQCPAVTGRRWLRQQIRQATGRSRVAADLCVHRLFPSAPPRSVASPHADGRRCDGDERAGQGLGVHRGSTWRCDGMIEAIELATNIARTSGSASSLLASALLCFSRGSFASSCCLLNSKVFELRTCLELLS
jgi:hypothetical protein